MAFSDDLGQLQADLLLAFFARERSFFLTGGGALVGFYLQHRRTDDLDLFTAEAGAFERGPYVLADSVEAIGGSMEARQKALGFHRYVVHRADEVVVVDLVHDRVPQLTIDKADRDGILIDTAEDIMANKLTALVSRSEIRDLVDVRALEIAGYSLDDALAGALDKDGACTPATLAWILSELRIPDGAKLPGDVSATELRAYVDDLVPRLRRLAMPANGPENPP